MKNEPIDHAFVVLQDAPISLSQKADLWDLINTSAPVDAFAKNLEAFNLQPHLVAALLTAKRLIVAERTPSRAEKVKAAAQQMSQIDARSLDAMERHPHVLAHLLQQEPSKKDA